MEVTPFQFELDDLPRHGVELPPVAKETEFLAFGRSIVLWVASSNRDVPVGIGQRVRLPQGRRYHCQLVGYGCVDAPILAPEEPHLLRIQIAKLQRLLVPSSILSHGAPPSWTSSGASPAGPRRLPSSPSVHRAYHFRLSYPHPKRPPGGRCATSRVDGRWRRSCDPR